MTDWNSDAAFITAFLLFPERFTAEEIRRGILDFLIHAPNHLAAAAKQHDYPIQDTFEVGALDGWPEDNAISTECQSPCPNSNSKLKPPGMTG